MKGEVMKMEVGTMVTARFSGNYIDFIRHAFTKSLISGVHVNILNPSVRLYNLFMVVAAPGVEELATAIKEFKGEVVL